jgi:hypothetical protein
MTVRPAKEFQDSLNSAPLLAVAYAFYCEALQGRQVWRGTGKRAGPQLYFRVATTVIATGPGLRRARIQLLLPPHVAEALAERCWDRGFTVWARRRGNRSELTLLDPFGLEITLKPRARISSNAA